MRLVNSHDECMKVETKLIFNLSRIAVLSAKKKSRDKDSELNDIDIVQVN